MMYWNLFLIKKSAKMNERLYGIMLADTVATEECIIIIKVTNKSKSIHEYAKEYMAQCEVYKDFLESREVKWEYPSFFYEEIRDFEESIKHRTDLTTNDISTMIKENIRIYLENHQHYAELLFDFYTDTSKTVEDLDKDLIHILTAKFM